MYKNVIVISVLIAAGMSGAIGFLLGKHAAPRSLLLQQSSSAPVMGHDPMKMSYTVQDAYTDEEFLEQMIAHHEDALKMSEAVLKTTKKEEIQNLASGIISAQEKEIVQMKTWLMQWQ